MAENNFTKTNAQNGIPGQTILNAGLNVFALKLLLESFTAQAGESTKPLEFKYIGVNVRLQIAEPDEAEQKE